MPLAFRLHSLIVSVVLLGLLIFARPSEARQDTRPEAGNLLHEAIDAMGGRERLESLGVFSWQGIEHRHALEQSERPDGPWLTTYFQIDELRDPANARAVRSTKSRSLLAGSSWNELSLIHDGEVTAMVLGAQMRPYPSSMAAPWIDMLNLAPERVLLTALGAEDLVYAGSTILQGVKHEVVAFNAESGSTRIFLNANTSLPTAVEINHPAYVDLWGDVPHRTYFSFWFLEENGIRYPRQLDTHIDGVPYSSTTISDITFDTRAPADTFAVSNDVRAMADRMNAAVDMRSIPLGHPNREPGEIAPGVVELPGRWDVAIVRQNDGLVILEAPISSEYSVQVIEEADRRFPGEPIKAVITTSDAWPHLAGVREYVARGIPVYAHKLNRDILERLVESNYATRPDALELNRRRSEFIWIDGHTWIGDGDNRIDIYPLAGEGSERMLMAHLPAHDLLYASDMLQKMPDGSFFMPQYPSEVVDAARREGLSVERAFAMHLGVTPWDEVLDVVRARRPGY